MTIDELAQVYANRVPNAILAKYFWIAIPQYRIQSNLTMLKPKKITVLQEYILRFIAVGVNSVKDISTYMGMNPSSVNLAIAKMAHDNLIIVDIHNATAQLTPAGTAAIDELNTVVPETIESDLLMDGLTGEVKIASKVGISPKHIKQLGLSAVVPVIPAPKLADLSYEAVSKAIEKYKKIQSSQAERFEGELQDVSEIISVSAEYDKAAVLVYINRDGDLAELQVFGGNSLANKRTEYETALTKMYKDGIQIFNLDAKSDVDVLIPAEDSEANVVHSDLISQELLNQAKDNSSVAAVEAQSSLIAFKSELTDIDDRAAQYVGIQVDKNETEALTQRKIELKREIQRLEDELAQQKAIRILSTYEHRPLLIDSLKTAKNSIVIISPWIKVQSIDAEIIELINGAVDRGVHITIVYGIGKKEDSDKCVVDKLTDIQKRSKKRLTLIAANNTHEKVLIKDDEYIIITSFNWMSFRGNSEWGFRRETGVYLESKEVIASMKEDISKRFDVQLT